MPEEVELLYHGESPLHENSANTSAAPLMQSRRMRGIRAKTRRPIILTVNGKPEAVVQSAAEYQRLVDIAASADVDEGIRQGLEDMREGRTCPADEVFEEMRRKYAISR